MPLPIPAESFLNPARDIVRICKKGNPTTPHSALEDIFGPYVGALNDYLGQTNKALSLTYKKDYSKDLQDGVSTLATDLRVKGYTDFAVDISIAIASFVAPYVAIGAAIGKAALDVGYALIDKREYIKVPMENALDIMNNYFSSDRVEASPIVVQHSALVQKLQTAHGKDIFHTLQSLVTVIDLTTAFLFKNGYQGDIFRNLYFYLVVQADYIDLKTVKDPKVIEDIKQTYTQAAFQDHMKKFREDACVIAEAGAGLINAKFAERIQGLEMRNEELLNNAFLEAEMQEAIVAENIQIQRNIGRFKFGRVAMGVGMVLMEVLIIFHDVSAIIDNEGLIDAVRGFVTEWNAFKADLDLSFSALNTNYQHYWDAAHKSGEDDYKRVLDPKTMNEFTQLFGDN